MLTCMLYKKNARKLFTGLLIMLILDTYEEVNIFMVVGECVVAGSLYG